MSSRPQIIWFKTSPDCDDPTCLCSWCEQPIGEHEAPIIRLFDSDAGTEARFHRRCLSDSGVMPGVTFPEAAIIPDQGFDDEEGHWEPIKPHEGD